MVGTSAHPPGVSGKSLSTYGTNPTLSPIADGSQATGTLDANIDMNEVFRNLVESVEARNRMVKRLNASKRIHRADHDYIEVVSEYEVEVDLPVSRINLARNNVQLPTPHLSPYLNTDSLFAHGFPSLTPMIIIRTAFDT